MLTRDEIAVIEMVDFFCDWVKDDEPTLHSFLLVENHTTEHKQTFYTYRCIVCGVIFTDRGYRKATQ